MGKLNLQENRFYLSRKLIGVIALFIAAASLLVVLTNFSINIIAASGDYTSLISKWNQHHYELGMHLERYGQSGQESDYRDYQREMKNKMMLEHAVEELFEDNPNVNTIFKAFPSQEHYPSEISSLIFTFEQFRNADALQNIQENWNQLHQVDLKQQRLVQQIRSEWQSEQVNRSRIEQNLERYRELNNKWRTLNQNLMDSVGKASLTIKRFGLWISVILGILLVLIGIVFSVRANKSIGRWEGMLREKEVLLSEIHHRVKNNLAVISGLLEMESMQNRDPERALQESRDRIQSMAMIHEILYQSNSFSEIDFSSYIQSLANHVHQTHCKKDQALNLRTNIEPVTLNINQAVPAGLILNEIMTNAIQHGFEEGDDGEMLLGLNQSQQEVQLSLKDNGRGLPKDFDLTSSDSSGLMIVDALVKQLEADIQFNNGDGMKFTLSFDKSDAPGSRNANL